MMSELFQQITAGIIILAASVYLIKHYYNKHKVKTGCASCKLMQTATRLNPTQKKQIHV